jgi:hypothetical protein
MPKSALSFARRLVFLERRGSYRSWSTLRCVGPSSPRKKLEPSGHREGRPRTHYKWPPYALVRHPIYTGLLLAFLGCAVARGEWRGLLAVALAFVALWRKLNLEGQCMRAQFGESYEAYSRRVAALVPHVI